jgi:hypothetical protein
VGVATEIYKALTRRGSCKAILLLVFKEIDGWTRLRRDLQRRALVVIHDSQEESEEEREVELKVVEGGTGFDRLSKL